MSHRSKVPRSRTVWPSSLILFKIVLSFTTYAPAADIPLSFGGLITDPPVLSTKLINTSLMPWPMIASLCTMTHWA